MTDKEIVDSKMFENHPYMKECACGTFNKVFTQEDFIPEYYTIVWTKCSNPECDQYLDFELPVN